MLSKANFDVLLSTNYNKKCRIIFMETSHAKGPCWDLSPD